MQLPELVFSTYGCIKKEVLKKRLFGNTKIAKSNEELVLSTTKIGQNKNTSKIENVIDMPIRDRLDQVESKLNILILKLNK